MSRTTFGGPKLPKILLDQVGGDDGGRKGRGATRRDRRKEERQEKKQLQRPSRPINPPSRTQRVTKPYERRKPLRESNDDEEIVPEPRKTTARTNEEPKPVKSILKKSKTPTVEAAAPEVTLSDEDTGLESDAGSDDSFTVSREAAKAGLADEDDEIAALERRLGVKSKKGSKRSQNEITDDDLDFLLGGLGDSDSAEEQARGTKRKRPAPEDEKWLKDKRRRAHAVESEESEDDDASAEEGDMEDDLENPFSEDELSGDDFEGFEAEDDDEEPIQPPPKRERENPYVAPVSKVTTAPQPAGKYIPPSLRKAAMSDEDAQIQQLKRQLQGQLNRLSDANLPSIVQAIEQLYTSNARQHVTSSLIDLLITRVSDPSKLEDPFLILHAGFCAALYKVMGVAFAGQLLEKVIEVFDRAYGSSVEQLADGSLDNKSSVNVLSFLTILYTLGVVGSTIVFDYIRQLLESNISEAASELLLAVLHFAGPQLRSEDPTSLKDITLMLQRTMADTPGGEASLSPRARFLVREIQDLKNNRPKAGGSRVLAAEQTAKMRKILGSMTTARAATLKTSEPVRTTLADIRDSEMKGKWWLPGASYRDPAKMAANGEHSEKRSGLKGLNDPDAGYESDTPGHVNLTKLARTQGMNTGVRQAIFLAIMSASDFADAHMRLAKLHLKNKQSREEIPRVLLHCVTSEELYNPYYALIAKKLCGGDARKSRELVMAGWEMLRKMQADADEDSDGEDGTPGRAEVRKIGHLAKFYGFLVVQSTASLAVMLRKVDLSSTYGMPLQTKLFVEALLTNVMLQAMRKAKKQMSEGDVKAAESPLKHMFTDKSSTSAEALEGLRSFIEKVVAKADLVSDSAKEVKAVRRGCDEAVLILAELAASAAEGGAVGFGSDSSSDVEFSDE